jgi:adenylate cyclase
MKIEIERKFLVGSDAWRTARGGIRYRQGYLCTDPERTVRVRIGGDTAILAVKGHGDGLSRPEFEFPIPAVEAEQLMICCCLQPVIDKVRYRIDFAGLTWEVDEFLGANHGLILAEIELAHPDQPVPLPPWIGPEVTGDPRYYNAYLARHPYAGWAGGVAEAGHGSGSLL